MRRSGSPVQSFKKIERTTISEPVRNLPPMASGRCDLLLADVTFPDGRVADLSIRDGIVCHAGSPLQCERKLSCRGFSVIPAAVDMHVHMRGGVQSRKEDWKSGSRSALAGGVTVVVDQPNTIPPLFSGKALQMRRIEAEKNSWCGFAINGGVTAGNDLEEIWREGAVAFGEIFVAPSSYGEGVPPESLMPALSCIGDLDALATLHAEEVNPGVPDDLAGHDRLRDPVGEVRIVGGLARSYQDVCRLHFCHLSVAEAVAAAGKASVEATPHHLFLSIEMGESDDGFLKVNPPLRHEAIRKELWKMWDQIDVIASDHAPHTINEKKLPFGEAPSGIPGVETMLPLLMAKWHEGRISLPSIMAKTSWTPSDLLGIPRAGFQPGMRADFAMYGSRTVPIISENLHSRSGWTPFEGMEGLFPERVIQGGTLVYDQGEFLHCSPKWYAGRGYHHA
jgi:dihydroorotase